MTTKDSLRILITSGLMLWFALLLAPPLLAAEAWQEIEHPSLDLLFSNGDSVGTTYREIVLDPVSVWYPEDDRHAAQHANDLRRSTSDLFADAITARGLKLVELPGDGVLIVSIQLIDLRWTDTADSIEAWARNFRFQVAPGRVTLVAEFRDADSGAVLVRMADLQEPERTSNSDAAEDALVRWGDIVAANIEALPGNPHLAALKTR